MQKGFVIIPILIGILVLGGVVGAWYTKIIQIPNFPPPGCSYKQVQCIQAPCNPILVCGAASPNPVVISQTPQTASSPSSSNVSPAPTGARETVNWKTYKNEQYGFEFRYPQNYIVNTTVNPNCDYLTAAQSSCLTTLSLQASDSGYAPKAYFYLLRGVDSVKINGQISGINFDSQRKVWVYNQSGSPEQVLSIWDHVKSGQEIIKSSTGGSHGSSYYYLIPDYQKDVVTIFTRPQSYRLRCDNFINDSSRQTQCNNFYNSVIQKYNGGQTTIDTWLPENFIQTLYIDAEAMVRSFDFP